MFLALGLIPSRQKRNCNAQPYWNRRDGMGKRRWSGNMITRRRGREMPGSNNRYPLCHPVWEQWGWNINLCNMPYQWQHSDQNSSLNASCNIKPHALWINRWLWVITENGKHTKGGKLWISTLEYSSNVPTPTTVFAKPVFAGSLWAELILKSNL